MASVYKQQLKTWVSTLDVYADTVLDIGGSQDPIKGRTKSWHVKEYLIADLPEPHIDSPKPDIELDLNHNADDLIIHREVDLIFCLEVFDYIYDPMSAFGNLAKLLKVGGEAWVSLPFVYPHHQPIEDEGLRYTEPAIRRYGDKFAMPVQEIIYRRPRSHKLLEFYAEDGFRAAKNYDHNIVGYIVRFKKL